MWHIFALSQVEVHLWRFHVFSTKGGRDAGPHTTRRHTSLPLLSVQSLSLNNKALKGEEFYWKLHTYFFHLADPDSTLHRIHLLFLLYNYKVRHQINMFFCSKFWTTVYNVSSYFTHTCLFVMDKFHFTSAFLSHEEVFNKSHPNESQFTFVKFMIHLNGFNRSRFSCGRSVMGNMKHT